MIQEGGRRHFHDELDSLQVRLVEMAGLVEDLLKISMAGLERRDPSVAARAKAEDDAIDEIEVEVDERVMELLALQQPMAKDLRQIITILKVANDLERVGDHAVNIAKATKRMSKGPLMPHPQELSEMSVITRNMLSSALASYVSRDSEGARIVCATDDRVDNLKRSLYRILLEKMREDPPMISAALELLLVSQNLERIADLSTNISEDVVFLVEGRSIKHHAEEREAD